MTSRAWWAFGFMSVVWGGSYLLIKIAINGGIPPTEVAWGRVALAAVVLVIAAWPAGTLGQLQGRWGWIAGYAVAEISIPFPLIAAGEIHVASSLTAIIIASVPLIVSVLSLRFDPSERPTPARALGLVLGFAGVVAPSASTWPAAARSCWARRRSCWARWAMRSARCWSSWGWAGWTPAP